ncbi:MAG: butyrate kinase [Candidatus Cryosericum sp.]
MRILAINPGSTSTKLGLFDDDKPIYKESLLHDVEELSRFSTSFEQKDFRTQVVLAFLARNNVDLTTIDAVIGRGGIIKPVKAGVYVVNERMLNDLKNSSVDHPSNLGGWIAFQIAGQIGAPAYIADPVCVDEFEDVARISGLKEIERPTFSHALNTRATLFKYAAEVHREISELNIVIGHLGGGISITAIKKGKMVDTVSREYGGPFSPGSSGELPTAPLIRFCFNSGWSEKQLMDAVTKNGGLASYLGVNDLRKVEEMIDSGNADAKLVFDAMCYQIAKQIGAMAAVLKGSAEAILLTGGMAYDRRLVSEITERVGWIAPVKVYPGEEELEALAGAALRVLRHEEEAREYV